MDPQESLEEHLKRLRCHFTWNLDSKSASNSLSCDVNVLEDKILSEIQGNPPVVCQAYLILAFAHTVWDVHKKVDYNKAFEYIELSEECANNNAEKYLVIANKVWILKIKRDIGDKEGLLKTANELQQEFTDSDESDLCLAEAFALSRFPPDGYERALERYKKAVELNAENGEAFFGIGQMLGRLRRIDQGQLSKASEEELQAFKESMKLWPNNPLPFVFYALALSHGVARGSSDVEKTINEMDRYMEEAKAKAEAFSSGSAVVYKWCAKGYKRICLSRMPRHRYLIFVNKQKQCVDRAVELSPNDSSVLHEAGSFYMHVKIYLDVEKADAYLVKSVECSPFRKNFGADFDLVKLRKQHQKDYDVLAAYSALQTKYSGADQDHRYLSSLHDAIASEYEELRDYDRARKEYVKSLSYKPNWYHAPKTAKRLPQLTEQFVEQSTNRFNSGSISQSMLIENLHEAGRTYETFRPRKSREAKKLYELILRLDAKNNSARNSLCDILLEMKLYDQCIEEASKLDQDEMEEFVSRVSVLKGGQ